MTTTKMQQIRPDCNSPEKTAPDFHLWNCRPGSRLVMQGSRVICKTETPELAQEIVRDHNASEKLRVFLDNMTPRGAGDPRYN